jgi:putative transposase
MTESSSEHPGDARQQQGAPVTALDDVINKRPVPTAEAEDARGVVRLAQEHGLSLTGPDGLLKQLTETVIETALS